MNILFSFLSALIIAIGFGPICISYFKNINFKQYIREEGPQSHLKKQGTPSFGGLIFLLAWNIVILIYNLESSAFTSIILSTVGFGIIGFLDDYLKIYRQNNLGLSGKQKMILIFFVSIFLFILFRNQIKLNFFNFELNRFWFLMFPIFLFISSAVTNAVNLTDGVDGLSASVTSIIGLFYAIIAYQRGMYDLCLLNIAFVGGLLGYLVYNVYPAKIMMGDTGSFAMGGFVLMNAFVLNMVWLLIIFGFVYVFETLSVIIQVSYYKKTKKRIFKMTPFHHHLELSGWNEYKIVIFADLVTLLLCIISYFIAIK